MVSEAPFTLTQLLRATAPCSQIFLFLRSKYSPSEKNLLLDKTTTEKDQDGDLSWLSESAQSELANAMICTPPPPAYYLRSICQAYMKEILQFERNCALHDLLATIFADSLHSSEVSKNENELWVNLHYDLPSLKSSLLSIRVSPKHNDVGVRKVWEAGAALAEYLIYSHRCRPECNISGKAIFELGAGVGLTGLVIASSASTSAYRSANSDHAGQQLSISSAKSIFMSDHTSVVLENLAHNVELNRKNGLLDECCCVSSGYFDWAMSGSLGTESMALINEKKKENIVYQDTFAAYLNADILIAADVIYDPDAVPSLVAAIKQFLIGNGGYEQQFASSEMNSNNTMKSLDQRQKCAIVATTKRNMKTFELFLRSIDQSCISHINEKTEIWDSIPCIFPCYFVQPRKDIVIHILKARARSNCDKA